MIIFIPALGRVMLIESMWYLAMLGEFGEVIIIAEFQSKAGTQAALAFAQALVEEEV